MDILSRQNLYYQTTKERCLCRDNKLESVLYGVDMPCFHRLSDGAQFPECPIVKLSLQEKFNYLDIHYEPIESDDLIITYDENQLNKEYAITIIKRYSKYKSKEKIIEYVEHCYCSPNDSYFISGKPVSLIQLIDEAIDIFTEKETQRKLNQSKSVKS